MIFTCVPSTRAVQSSELAGAEVLLSPIADDGTRCVLSAPCAVSVAGMAVIPVIITDVTSRVISLDTLTPPPLQVPQLHGLGQDPPTSHGSPAHAERHPT